MLYKSLVGMNIIINKAAKIGSEHCHNLLKNVNDKKHA